MISSTHDLPPRGNYFAEDGYISQDLKSGTIHNRAGARMIALTDDFLVALLNSLEAELGDRAAPVLKAAARDWGRRAAEQFSGEMEKHYGKPLSELPLGLFAADLTEAFRHHGWGVLRFNLNQYTQGVLSIEVENPIVGAIVKPAKRPVEGLLAGFLAGMFSYFAGLELDCAQTDCRACGVAQSRFVLSVPQRLHVSDGRASNGRNHTEVLRELLQSRA
jgi:predicted hydrocarbon binding protein